MIPTNLKLSGFQVDGVNVELATPTTIKFADVPNTSFTIEVGGSVLTYDNTQGGAKTLPAIPNEEYKITSSKGWSTTITIKEGVENIVNLPYETNYYSVEELHTALQGGYFSVMFRAGFVVDFSTSGIEAPYNDKYFIEEIKTIDGKDQAKFRFAKAGESREIFPYFAYVAGAGNSSFNTRGRANAGGYKCSEVRKLFMKQGDEVYSQVTSLKPMGSPIVNGITFNQLYYTGTETIAKIYSYDGASDTFIEDGAYNGVQASVSGETDIRFVKGYFLKVGTLTEPEFTGKHYYTFDGTIYTTAGAFDGATEYYGFYETMQRDGEFLSKFQAIRSYMVATNDYSTTNLSGSNTTLTTDLLDLASIEEITGLNKTSKLVSGTPATNINFYNNTGEGTKKQGYDGFDKQANGSYYWCRSLCSYNSYSWCGIYTGGSVYSYKVSSTYGVRLGFILA